MKLRNRINLYTTVLFLLLLVVLNTVIYATFSQMILKSELDRTVAEAEQAIKGMTDSKISAPISEQLRARVPLNAMMQVVKQDGTRAAAVTVPEQQNLWELPVEYYQQEVQRVIDFNGIPHAFVSIPMVWDNGEIVNLQVTEDLEVTADMLRILRIVLIIVTLIATIPVVISSLLLSNFISRPITSMIGTMKEIRTSGRFKRIPLPKQSKDELYQMGETFNSMIDLLEENYEKQGQFISNASHELNTPLTIIESYASLLQRRGKDQPELFDEAVQAIYSESIRMKELTQQLLLLAKHDAQAKIKIEDFSVNVIVEELVRSVQKAYKREILLEIDGSVLVSADQQRFKQLFYILMDNARKYSEDAIEVDIYSDQHTAVVEIKDRGIGIPQQELERIFDRFYRVDKARTRKTGGFGLGLSLAKDIAESMGARIEIESMEGYGTKAKILLKVAHTH